MLMTNQQEKSELITEKRRKKAYIFFDACKDSIKSSITLVLFDKYEFNK